MIDLKAICRGLLVAATVLLSTAQAQTLPLDWHKINNEFSSDDEVALSAGAAFERR